MKVLWPLSDKTQLLRCYVNVIQTSYIQLVHYTLTYLSFHGEDRITAIKHRNKLLKLKERHVAKLAANGDIGTPIISRTVHYGLEQYRIEILLRTLALNPEIFHQGLVP